MMRSLTILSCALAGLAASASAQTVSTTTIVPSTAAVQASTAAVRASTAAATAPSASVAPSTAPAPGGDAWRPGRGIWHRDCDADVARFCPGVTTREQVENCLRTNESRLSLPCQRIRQEEGRRMRERRR